MAGELEQWAATMFGGCDFGDVRLTARAVKMAAAMVENPNGSLPQQMASGAALRGAYRLLNNNRVTFDSVIKSHVGDTVGRIREHTGNVLLIQDSSYMGFSHHPATQGLGPISTGVHNRGFLFHSTLAVDEVSQIPLGIAQAQLAVREKDRPKFKHGRRGSVEGQFWESAVRQVGPAPKNAHWTYVADREGDLYAFLIACLDAGAGFVVRAKHNRKLEAGDGELPGQGLLQAARAMPANQQVVPFEARIAKAGLQPARTATLTMNWSELNVHPTRYRGRGQKPMPKLKLHVLHIWEIDPPAGAEQVEWILLSSIPIDSVAAAHRIRHIYMSRWNIEDFHMCIKTGCQYQRSQLDEMRDLGALLGFIAPLAVRLLALRRKKDVLPDERANLHEDPMLVTLLAQKLGLPRDMTLHMFWRGAAQLGGYVGNWKKHPPGWRTLWAGISKLHAWAAGARLLTKSNA